MIKFGICSAMDSKLERKWRIEKRGLCLHHLNRQKQTNENTFDPVSSIQSQHYLLTAPKNTKPFINVNNAVKFHNKLAAAFKMKTKHQRKREEKKKHI